jgi:hypothetical protein
MTTAPVQVERRVGQRFSYFLPISLREPAGGVEALGCTQDVSSRGVFFLTAAVLQQGCEIELTLKMPSEITLGESMRVRCRGRVLRVVRSEPPLGHDRSSSSPAETKIGVAVRLEGYEYLADSEEPASVFVRVAALHPHDDSEKPLAGD